MNLDVIALISVAIANLGAILGIYYHFERRVDRVYERMDEELEKMVRKDACKVMHENTTSNLLGSESRIEKRFDKLEEKLEQLIQGTLLKIMEVLNKRG